MFRSFPKMHCKLNLQGRVVYTECNECALRLTICRNSLGVRMKVDLDHGLFKNHLFFAAIRDDSEAVDNTGST